MTTDIKTGPVRALASVVGFAQGGKGGVMPVQLAPQAAAATGPLSLLLVEKRVSRRVQPHAEYGDLVNYDFQQSWATTYLNTVSGSASVVGDGTFKINTLNGTANLFTVGNLTPDVPNFMMSATCSFAGNGVAADNFQFGLYKDANNYVSWQFDNFASKVAFVGKIAGSTINVANNYAQSMAGFTKFGVSLSGSNLTAWGFNGKVWLAFTTIDLNANVTFTTSMSGWLYAVWGTADGATAPAISDFRISRFGGVGIRDMKFITYENGEPLVIGGSLFFTGTISSPGDSTGRGCGLGVYSFDPLSYAVKMVGTIMFQSGGITFGGASGKIVMDRNTASWWVFISSYGFTTTQVTYQQADVCPLFGMNVLTNITQIPNTRNDMDLLYYNSQWYMVCCKTSVTPTLITAATIPLLASATPVDTGLTNNEGCCLRMIGGTPYMMFQDYTTPGWVVRDLANNAVGRLNVNGVTSNGLPANGTQAHPNIIAMPVPGGTKYYGVTFTGQAFNCTLTGVGSGITATAYANGETVIYESQLVAGKEFPDIRNGSR